MNWIFTEKLEKNLWTEKKDSFIIGLLFSPSLANALEMYKKIYEKNIENNNKNCVWKIYKEKGKSFPDYRELTNIIH